MPELLEEEMIPEAWPAENARAEFWQSARLRF